MGGVVGNCLSQAEKSDQLSECPKSILLKMTTLKGALPF
jgi:hypothetical protein